MIAELDSNLINLKVNQRGTTYRSVLFPEPAIKSISHQYESRVDMLKTIRFPWTHKTDPIFFHSVSASLSKNHEAVPVRCAFQMKS
jgi:hypothetical protein